MLMWCLEELWVSHAFSKKYSTKQVKMIRCHSLLYTQKRLLHYYISDYERTLLPLQGVDTIY